MPQAKRKGMHSLLPRNIMGLFGLMEVAEEEILAAAERHPTRQDAIGKAFGILYPTMNMTQTSEKVYRAHVRELLDRVGRGQLEGAELGTTAEVMLICSEASFKAPLNQNPTTLFARTFRHVFKDSMDVSDLDRETHPGAVRELEHELRRKCAVGERKTFIKETLHGHQEAIFDLAA